MKCKVKRCNRECEVIYKGYPVCDLHFGLHCGDTDYNLNNELKIKKNNGLQLSLGVQ